MTSQRVDNTSGQPSPPPELFGDLASIEGGPEERRALLAQYGDPTGVLAGMIKQIDGLVLQDLSSALERAYLLVATADELADMTSQLGARRALAQALSYATRFDEALSILDEAADLAARDALLQSRRDLALVNLLRLHALSRLGRFDEAVQAGETARTDLLQLGDSVTAATADVNLGVVQRVRGRPADALIHFDRARPIFADKPVVGAQIESNRAAALLDLHEFEAAETAFRAALNVFQEAGVQRAAAIAEGNLADLMGRQGRLADSIHHFERARRRIEADGSPGDAARLQNEAAEVQLEMGMLDEAACASAQAAQTLEAHGLTAEAARAHAALGRALAALGHYGQANIELTRAATQFRTIGQTHSAARAELAQAQLLLVQHRNEEARHLANSLLQSADSLRDRPADAAAAHSLLASIHLRSGRPDAALASADTGLRLAEQLDLAPLRSDLLHRRGQALVRLARLDEGLVAFHQALEQTERIRGSLQADRFRTAFHARRASLYEDAVAAILQHNAPDHIASAFAVIESSRSRALLDLLASGGETQWSSWSRDPGSRDLLQQLSRWRERLNALYTRLHNEGGAPVASSPNYQEQIAQCEREIATIESRLAATGEFTGLFSSPVSLQEASELLDSGVGLVEYFIAGGRILAFIVRPDAPPQMRELAAVDDVLNGLERFRFQIARATARGALRRSRSTLERSAADCRRELTTLHELLIEPLSDDLAGLHRLVIAPHGPLHSLPFHALCDDSAFLIERFEIVYTPSASILNGLRRKSREQPTSLPVVVGVADDMAPEIKREASEVAAVLEPSRLLLGEEATVASFMEACTGAPLIHIASHGSFSALAPASSGIRLADGWLTAREAGALALPGSLVTLSGCETGRSAATAGDELLGLVRAFLAGGAETVLATLWAVHDETATNLLASTYRKWYLGKDESSTRTLASALREVQIELLSAGTHPAFWAPFFVAGKP